MTGIDNLVYIEYLFHFYYDVGVRIIYRIIDCGTDCRYDRQSMRVFMI